MYGLVRVSKNASVYFPIMLPKNAPVYMLKFLFMSQNQSLRMLLYPCLYLGFQEQLLLYAYISISKIPLSICPSLGLYIWLNIYMPIARIPISKCIYAKMPLCVCKYQGLQTCFSICNYIRLSKDTHIHMAIYESLDMPNMIFNICQYQVFYTYNFL